MIVLSRELSDPWDVGDILRWNGEDRCSGIDQVVREKVAGHGHVGFFILKRYL